VTAPVRITGTAGHLHAYFPLQQPVSILAAEAANRRLAAQLGADSEMWGVADVPSR